MGYWNCSNNNSTLNMDSNDGNDANDGSLEKASAANFDVHELI